MNLPVDDLDTGATLAAVSSTLRWRRAAEVEDLRLAAHWADLHAADPREARRAQGLLIRIGEHRLVDLGGPGTPRVQEYAIAALAIAREIHPLAAQRLVADALDLRHRLPQVWARVQGLEAEAWVARKVAALTRPLTTEQVALVDAAVAEAIGSESPARVLETTRAKVVEADPATHHAKVEAERRRRYAALGRVDEHGLQLVIARVTAGDAAWLDAMLERVADVLAARHAAVAVADPTRLPVTRDELRSEAMGWLARPAELLALLLDDASTSPTDEHAAESEPEPEQCRAFAFPADVLDALRSLDPTRLRPRAVLYVHLHQAAVDGTGPAGVARVEGLGPIGLGQLADLLGHAQVTVKPVIDLRDQISVNAYEHPEALKERVHLSRVGDYFPYATSTSRRTDLDHPTPYDEHGPPGQTGTLNSGPLTRRHHRYKTHGGYSARQTGPGTYVWRTPHGHYLRVDRTGTHPLHPVSGRCLFAGTPVEVRLADDFACA
jgi:hypothetical protein